MIRITLSAVVLTFALTACGGAPLRVGAAATLGGGSISQSQLDSAVDDWEAAFKADPLPAQQLSLADPESTERSILYRLIEMRVFAQAAKDAGITVTPAQIDQAMTQLTQGGGPAQFQRGAVAYGVPPKYSRDFAKLFVIQNRLSAGATTQEQANQKLAPALQKAADKLDVKLNPRYGVFKDGDFGKPVTGLSRQETGTA